MKNANQTYRVVLDTNQIIAAGTCWLEHGRPAPDGNLCRRILIRVAESHTGLYCGKIIGEYLEKLIDLNHPPERAKKMIAYIIGAFARVPIVTLSAPFKPSDPDDEVFLLCAIDGEADYLISDDAALLELISSYKIPRICCSTDAISPLTA
jgi:predicted nucleic acid-binding protein